MTAVKNHLGEFGPVVSSEAELLALPFVTLSGSTIQVAQSFRVKGNVTLSTGNYISVTAPGVVISEVQSGQITGAVASPGHLIETAQNDLRVEDMKLQNTGSGDVLSVTGESPAIVRCDFTAALGHCIVFGAGTLDTEVVDCVFDTVASAHCILMSAQRPLLVDGCDFRTGKSGIGYTASGTYTSQRIVNNKTVGAVPLMYFDLGAATVLTIDPFLVSGNALGGAPVIYASSPAGSTAQLKLYDFTFTNNQNSGRALIDSDIESTAAIGLDIFDGVITGNISIGGSSGFLFYQRKAATTRWKEITVTGNNFESGGMQIDAGSNYAETCSFVGNSIGSGKYLFIHSHPSNTSNSSSFSGNSLESGGKLLEIRYPGIGGGLLRTSTIDGNALISGTLITATGTVVNPILQNCAINGNIALTALSGASPFDTTTMGSNTEARGNYGQDDFGPGIVGSWNNLTLQGSYAGTCRWRYLDGKARVEFEYNINKGGAAVVMSELIAQIPTEARPAIVSGGGSLCWVGGNKLGQAGGWHVGFMRPLDGNFTILAYPGVPTPDPSEPQDVFGNVTWSVG